MRCGLHTLSPSNSSYHHPTLTPVPTSSSLQPEPPHHVSGLATQYLSGVAQHPLSGDRVDFARTSVFSLNSRLLDRIENQPDVAVRRGTLVHQGWELGRSAIRALVGLDIAALAFKRLVSTIVVVTGDSDLVPAMKLARREGLRVHLDPLGRRQVRDELKIHADRVL